MIAANMPAGSTPANGAGMPVVVYFRKSNKTKHKTRDETVSIKQQRVEVVAWCESRGWIIVREYVDDGRSASKNEGKRVEFAKMLADVEGRADFRAVVVWDLSRLTRRDSVDAAKAAGVFKAERILVESLRDGEIDLTTSMGRTFWTLHTEANSEFAKKISAGTIRGRGDSIKAGKWPHGKIPYGYRRQYWDGDRLIQELHRNEPAGKARHWATMIVPDPDEAKYAAQIIREFATRDVSLRGLAIEMQRAGAPTTSGKPWSAGHVKDIIRAPVYIGDIGVGYSWGWKRSVEGKGYEAHGHSPQQFNTGACPAIIDRPTWERANAKLAALKISGTRVHSGKSSPLSGIIFCGHCGKRMNKFIKKGVTRFVCSTAAKNPENPTCKQWTVQERDLLPIFTTRLAEAVDFKLLEGLAAKPPEADTTQQLASLDAQEAKLQKQVAKAARNLALCDPEHRDDVQAVLTELKDDLDRVKNTTHLIRTAADKTELQRASQWWQENRQTLVTVMPSEFICGTRPLTPLQARKVSREGVVTMKGDYRVPPLRSQTDTFRELLKRLDARLTLHFTPKAQGANAKKQYYALEWGRLEATLDGHSFDATRPANHGAPTAPRCAPASPPPGPCRHGASATRRRTPAWPASNCRRTSSWTTPVCC